MPARPPPARLPRSKRPSVVQLACATVPSTSPCSSSSFVVLRPRSAVPLSSSPSTAGTHTPQHSVQSILSITPRCDSIRDSFLIPVPRSPFFLLTQMHVQSAPRPRGGPPLFRAHTPSLRHSLQTSQSTRCVSLAAAPSPTSGRARHRDMCASLVRSARETTFPFRNSLVSSNSAPRGLRHPPRPKR